MVTCMTYLYADVLPIHIIVDLGDVLQSTIIVVYVVRLARDGRGYVCCSGCGGVWRNLDL